jgi:hypothetical protein
MKKLFFGLITASMLMACNQKGNTTQTAHEGTPPVIKFTEELYNFGKIKQGDSVTHNFSFVNAGKSPLLITNAVATCGCTTPQWPKDPVNPGDSGKIKVTFKSAGKSGVQDKMITISANTTPSQNMVHLVGEVTVSK